MGMSSSQARLLSLTARQHDVELKAQMLEAQKLQMANDSDRVYNKYINALSATKIQARIYDQYEGDTFKDASLAMLVNAAIPNEADRTAGVETACKALFLQEISSGKLMITPEYAVAFGIEEYHGTLPATLEEYLIEEGLEKTTIPIDGTKPEDLTNPDIVGDHGIATEHIGYKFIEDPYGKIDSYNGVDVNVGSNFRYTTNNLNGNKVECEIGSKNLETYNNFQTTPTHSSTATLTSLSDVATVAACTGTKYAISSVEDLKQLQKLVADGLDTTGKTFVLGADINMESVTGWSGIGQNSTSGNIFKGTFDGNGYTISNLTGTQGLFNSVGSTGVVKNLGLANVNISSTSTNGTGAVTGKLAGTVENCYVTGSVTAKGHVGGIVGENGDTGWAGGTIKNCNLNIEVDGTTSLCVGGVSGHNSGTVTGCNVSGSVTNNYSSGWVGGLVGHNTGTTSITNCITNAEVTTTGTYAGSVIGYTDNDNLTITDVTYNKVDGQPICGNKSDLIWDSGIFKTTITTPSIDSNGGGSFYSNIYAALIKTGTINLTTLTDEEKVEWEQKIKDYVKLIYDPTKSYTEEEKSAALLQVANINTQVCKAINGETGTAAFMEALAKDVTDTTKTNTTAEDFQKVYTADAWQAELGTEPEWNPISENKGQITLASEEQIVAMIVKAYKINADKTDADTAEIERRATQWINKFDTNNMEQMAYLAAINQALYDYGQGNGDASTMGKILQDVINLTVPSEVMGMISAVDGKPERYNITFGNGEASKVTETVKQTSQEYKYYTFSWDWSNDEVAAAVARYNILKTGFIIIGDDDTMDYESIGCHTNTNWLTNVINSGIAQFVEFDYSNGGTGSGDDGSSSYSENQIRGTSVASETCLQEVADKTYLAAAEATYEKEMKSINRKETKIDTQLSALEAERSSIKSEQDSLKKVIDDNVNLTFKLFS